MAQIKILIHNAEIVNEGRCFRGFVSILSDGNFGEVAEGTPSQELIKRASEVVDAAGKYLLPGVIDTHVHFRDPGLTQKGDMETESLAALAGGVTSVIDMPNTKPATATIADWEAKMDRASKVCAVNYGFYLGATADNLKALKNADYSRVAGIKLFLGSSTGNMLLDDPESLKTLFSTAPTIVAVHAESETLITAGREEAMKRFEGQTVPIPMHAVIRSRRACVEATRKAVTLAKKADARLHVLHISTADELQFFTAGAASDKKITAETCPNYLLFSAIDYPKLGSRVKCNPAIKLPHDRDMLRQAVAQGVIDTIATDHAPHLLADKEGDALTATSGMPMIQFSLPAMLDLAAEGCFPIETVVEKMAHNPATIYRIDRRGFIRPGYHADCVLVEKTPFQVNANSGAGKILSRCGWSPIEGRTLNHLPVAVYINGNLAYTPISGMTGASATALQFNN